MKIGILYICTGLYDVFWEDFYLSAERYLLEWHELYYFVFTDAQEIYDEKNNDRIHRISQPNLPWPDITLMRFHMFYQERERLKWMDYLFFFNSNLEIKQKIWNEILPPKDAILVTQHPWFFSKKNTDFSYDRNIHSSAYIKKWDGDVYIAWWLNGWYAENFLEMCKNLSENIDTDTRNWCLARWHDESHINKYILTHKYKLLNPGYLYPEWKKLPFECKVLIRDKRNYSAFGNYYYKQWRKISIFTRFLSFFWK